MIEPKLGLGWDRQTVLMEQWVLFRMIIDACGCPDGQSLTADLCIVGAGAGGIAMALQFIDTSLDVLVLESGGMDAEPETQALYEGTVADEKLHSPPDR